MNARDYNLKIARELKDHRTSAEIGDGPVVGPATPEQLREFRRQNAIRANFNAGRPRLTAAEIEGIK